MHGGRAVRVGRGQEVLGPSRQGRGGGAHRARTVLALSPAAGAAGLGHAVALFADRSVAAVVVRKRLRAAHLFALGAFLAPGAFIAEQLTAFAVVFLPDQAVVCAVAAPSIGCTHLIGW